MGRVGEVRASGLGGAGGPTQRLAGTLSHRFGEPAGWAIGEAHIREKWEGLAAP